MRKTNRREVLAMGTSAAALTLLGAGADKPKPLFGKKEPPLKADQTVSDLAFVHMPPPTRVEGVGLVAGLDGTGSDPEPSVFRQKLVNRLRQAQLPNIEKMLQSKQYSMVIVRGEIPAGITPEDRLDVEISLTQASATQSLAGGTLLETELSVVGVADGKLLEGKVMAKAHGPVLTGSKGQPDDLRSGRVLGGARCKQETPCVLTIKRDHQSVKTAALLEGVVGKRFFYMDGLSQKSMAQAVKSDKHLILHVPKIYHQNPARFFQVLMLMPIFDEPSLRQRRVEAWSRELLDPKTAGTAALKLEGIGANAVATLKTGLASPDANVRFFAAESLAYLNDGSGSEVLAQAVLTRPNDFRAFALAAMAATDDPASLMKLRELMSYPDKEVRYGAFNALRTLDEQDAFLGRVRVRHDDPLPDPEEIDGDEMAYQIAKARKASRARPDPFHLYLVDCEGPPMIHVSNARRAEIVVFGKRQKLLTPCVLGGAGSVLINGAVDDQEVQVARVDPSDPAVPELKVSSRPEVGAVIREAANLGAGYPEIVAILQAAERQKNLEGPLVVDAIPAPKPAYDKAQLASEKADGDAKKDPGLKRTSGEGSGPGRRILDRFRRDRSREKK